MKQASSYCGRHATLWCRGTILLKDIHRKLRVQSELILVGLSSERLVATVMAGYEVNRPGTVRGCFVRVGVTPV